MMDQGGVFCRARPVHSEDISVHALQLQRKSSPSSTMERVGQYKHAQGQQQVQMRMLAPGPILREQDANNFGDCRTVNGLVDTAICGDMPP